MIGYPEVTRMNANNIEFEPGWREVVEGGQNVPPEIANNTGGMNGPPRTTSREGLTEHGGRKDMPLERVPPNKHEAGLVEQQNNGNSKWKWLNGTTTVENSITITKQRYSSVVEIQDKLKGLNLGQLRVHKRIGLMGSTRFEVTCPEGMKAWNLMGKIKESIPELRGVTHKTYRTQGKRWVSKEQKKYYRELDSVSIGAWNINGILKKGLLAADFIGDRDVVGLLELVSSDASWQLQLPNYHILQRNKNAVMEGGRGIAIAVRKDIPAYTISVYNNNFIFIRIIGEQGRFLIIGLVYLLQSHNPDFQRAKKGLKSEVSRIQSKFPNDPLILIGDFNKNCKKVASMFKPNKMTVMETAGSSATYKSSIAHMENRAIDHVLASEDAKDLVCKCKVLNDFEGSNHYPISAVVKMPALRAKRENVPDKLIWNKPRLRKLISLAHHNNEKKMSEPDTRSVIQSWRDANRWSAFESDVDTLDVDKATESFTETLNSLGNELELREVRKSGKARHGNRRIAKIIRKRREAYRAWMEANSDTKLIAESNYKLIRKEVKRQLKKEQDEWWIKAISKAMEQRSNDPRSLWKWLDEVSGHRQNQLGTQSAMRDSDGTLRTKPEEIDEVFSRHYELMATGNIQAETSQCPSLQQLPRLEGIDHEPTWPETCKTIRKLKLAQGGEDGLPVEIFKLIELDNSDPSEAGNDTPTSLPAKAFLLLLIAVYRRRIIPERWKISLIISIFKSGDPADPNNYRGISLMNVGCKIMMAILAERISSKLENEFRLSASQAGFRKKEEAVLQATCLYEVLAQRRNRGKKTYVLFLDLVKAYDRVSHNILFEKMKAFGIRGSCLEFIMAMYNNSCFAVRNHDGGMGRKTQLKTGLRQGCPLSPILFNIFINDLLQSMESKGLGVNLNWTSSTRVLSGLLFADDGVILAPSHTKLKLQLSEIDAWCELNQMECGVSKCGLMAVGASDNGWAQDDRWKINGKQIPWVQGYKYLGVYISEDLDLDKAAACRLTEGWNAICRMRSFLKNPRIPQALRIEALRTYGISHFYYGSELWGGNRKITTKFQVKINHALRWILGVTRIDKIPNKVMWTELGVNPFHEACLVGRFRLYFKALNSKTRARDLIKPTDRTKKMTWVTRTESWIKKYFEKHVNKGMLEIWIENVSKADLKAECQQVRKNIVAERLQQPCKTDGMEKLYEDSGFEHIRQGKTFEYSYMAGSTLISKARLGRNIKEIEATCQLCGQEDSMQHLLCECPNMDEERSILLELVPKERDAMLLGGYFELGRSLNIACQLLLGGVMKFPGRKDRRIGDYSNYSYYISMFVTETLRKRQKIDMPSKLLELKPLVEEDIKSMKDSIMEKVMPAGRLTFQGKRTLKSGYERPLPPNNEQVIRIYTDGSSKQDPSKDSVRAGWGFVATLQDKTETESWGGLLVSQQFGQVITDPADQCWIGADKHSNNTAELSAIMEALLWVSHREYKGWNIEILYDSVYAARSIIGDYNGTTSREMVRKGTCILTEVLKNNKVKFRKVKAHKGIFWNERADSLAEQGVFRSCKAGRRKPDTSFVNEIYSEFSERKEHEKLGKVPWDIKSSEDFVIMFEEHIAQAIPPQVEDEVPEPIVRISMKTSGKFRKNKARVSFEDEKPSGNENIDGQPPLGVIPQGNENLHLGNEENQFGNVTDPDSGLHLAVNITATRGEGQMSMPSSEASNSLT
jgi:ribonuclease HI/exonuclease III